ncbi:protein FAM57A isoform X1 [Gadus morhua]|uniref:TLC domain containing 3A n=1 Tax=Gadus morhua TaxID=8049 RepID=A0A8C4ZPA8_GADMO|nr:TLC domain-containing protein 3A isoform X1 [Gadus morhua]
MLYILACGMVFFPGLFCGLRKVLKSAFTHWSDADVVVVSERLVSSVHASLATVSGVLVVNTCRDVMNDRHWLVNSFVLFGAPYMAYDLYAMYLSHYHQQRLINNSAAHQNHSLQTVKAFLSKERLLVFHHMALLLVFMPIVLFFRRDLGDFFIACFWMTEFSTPFVSLGKILIQLGLENSKLHWINGVMVLCSFFTCRILLFPYMYWMYGQQFDLPLHSVPFHLPLHCNVGNLSIMVPQVYWFILLVKKAHRLYRRKVKDQGPKQE